MHVKLFTYLRNEIQKNQQAYKIAGKLYFDVNSMNISEIRDEDFVLLMPPGKNGKATYCYKLNYFDKTRASDIQLIVFEI